MRVARCGPRRTLIPVEEEPADDGPDSIGSDVPLSHYAVNKDGDRDDVDNFSQESELREVARKSGKLLATGGIATRKKKMDELHMTYFNELIKESRKKQRLLDLQIARLEREEARLAPPPAAQPAKRAAPDPTPASTSQSKKQRPTTVTVDEEHPVSTANVFIRQIANDLDVSRDDPDPYSDMPIGLSGQFDTTDFRVFIIRLRYFIKWLLKLDHTDYVKLKMTGLNDYIARLKWHFTPSFRLIFEQASGQAYGNTVRHMTNFVRETFGDLLKHRKSGEQIQLVVDAIQILFLNLNEDSFELPDELDETYLADRLY